MDLGAKALQVFEDLGGSLDLALPFVSVAKSEVRVHVLRVLLDALLQGFAGFFVLASDIVQNTSVV